jgi:Polyketide cyclase / dehydrase and lipid transport
MPGSTCVVGYDRTFVFPVSVARLWTSLAEFDHFTSWWAWLQEFSADGDGLAPGTVFHGLVAPPLPYRMRLDVVIEECVAERSIVAAIHGDLEGTARLLFTGDDAETRVRATWSVEMMQRPMRLAARLGYPLLRWGHDRVVDATVEGFRRQLEAEDRGA